MSVSPHGLVIAILQGLALVGVLWWHARLVRGAAAAGRPTGRLHAIFIAAVLIEYAVLRVQPIRMGGSAFAYTLGLFDGFTAAALVVLVVRVVSVRRRSDAERPAA